MKSNLDLLRSIAITLVVVDHFTLSTGRETVGPWFVGDLGLFGVYLFFVHTSLVLMWSLERRPNVLDFYIRRVFRIYPLAIATILIAAACHARVAGIAGEYFHAPPINVRTVVANLTLFPGIVARKPLIHGVTWSLAPELLMYVLLPYLFAFAIRFRKVWPLILLWAMTARLAYISVPVAAGNQFAVLIPDFICGIIAYVGFKERTPRLPSWAFPVFLSVLLVFYMAGHHYRADWYACLALGLLLPSFQQMRSPRLVNFFERVARYSYGAYLIHPLTIWVGMYVLAAHSFTLKAAVSLAPIPLLSYVAYRSIEGPFIVAGAKVAAISARERGLPEPRSVEEYERAA